MYHSLFTYHTFRLFPVFHYCKELQWTQYLYKYWHTWAKISGGWFPTNGITGSICKITRTLYDFPKRLIYTNTLIHLYSHQARIRVTIIQKKKECLLSKCEADQPTTQSARLTQYSPTALCGSIASGLVTSRSAVILLRADPCCLPLLPNMVHAFIRSTSTSFKCLPVSKHLSYSVK